jgi:hypothetical protein
MERKKYGDALERSAPALAQPDRFVQETLAAVRAHVERGVTDVTRYAQRSPEKALISALAGGYVLRMLPVTRILGGIVRLTLVLLKPAALIYGAAKLWQKTQGGAASRDGREDG